LNHISGSRAGIAGVYQRHDWATEKRAALDAWAGHVLAVVEGQTATPNVVTLVRALNRGRHWDDSTDGAATGGGTAVSSEPT
jgi:hypothetical protein